jgi:sec-independent protein translocase protein TatA
MGDVAKGIKSFKKGLSDDDDAAKADGKAIDSSSPAAKVDAERTKTG